jgi:hypothetical protein
VLAVIGLALLVANHVAFPEPPGVGQQAAARAMMQYV